MQTCVPCGRSFGSETALRQHQQDSPVHAETYDCELCNRSFSSVSALEQHQRDSSAHAETFDCNPCNRSFSSVSALEQHQQDSSAHAEKFDCNPCNRSFSSVSALEQHQRDSSAHAEKFDCNPCNRSFSSVSALEQHQQDSSAHAETFDCNPCNRSFSSVSALEQHQRDSSAHAETFDCNPCNRSFSSVSALERHQRDSSAHAEKFDCKPCNRSFSSASALEQHQRDAPIHQHVGSPLVDPFPMTPPPLYNAQSPHHAQTDVSQTRQRPEHKVSRASYTFPKLHDLINSAVVPYLLRVPLFHLPSAGFNKEHSTTVVGNFLCTNRTCPKHSWGSKVVAIVIREYRHSGYSAEVFGQRCKVCNGLGALTLDVESYVERVAFRLKRWEGIRMEEPPFKEKQGPPHEIDLCEGCARGVCRLGGD